MFFLTSMLNTSNKEKHLMARPKPTIILDSVDKSYNSEQILNATS